MAKKGIKTSAKALKTLGEYVDTKMENISNGEPIFAYNSKLESVLVLYGKIYKEER